MTATCRGKFAVFAAANLPSASSPTKYQNIMSIISIITYFLLTYTFKRERIDRVLCANFVK
jgi:hypothetical protein